MQIPEALAAYHQFVLWRAVPDASGKTNKYPVNSEGRKIDAHDPANWLSAAEALAAAGVTGLGVAFVFTENDPFFFLDIDNCRESDGWSLLAQQLCGFFAGCYIEVSQSGNGLHVFGTAANRPHGCKNIKLKLELYTERRFCALTGIHAMGTPSQLAQGQFDWVITNYFPPTEAADPDVDWTDGPVAEWSGPTDDDELIRRMLASKPSVGAAFGNRASIADLWNANEDVLAQAYPPQSTAYPYDHSSADAALCQHLAFWTGKDCERIDRLFRQSALYRDKWEDREGYRQTTVLKSVRYCRSVYSRQSDPTPAQTTDPEPQTVDPDTGIRAGLPVMTLPSQIDHFKNCVYIRDLHCMWVPDGAMLTPERFKAAYGGYTFQMDMVNDRRTKSAWEAFTESGGYTFPKAHSACFRPELPPGHVFEEEGYQLVNTYVPVTTQRAPGDPTPFLAHLTKMIPIKHDRDILLNYMAAIVQNPGRKVMWAPLIQGTKGNGKSLLGDMLAYCIGHRYTEKPDPNDIGNKFNAWLTNKLLVVIDEAYCADRDDMENALKRLITNKRVAVQGKGMDQVTGDNRANFFLNTNNKAAIRIDDDERRYAVFFCAQQEKSHIDRDGMGGRYFINLVRWLEEESGFAIINNYLRSHTIPAEYDPFAMPRAPETSSTQAAIRASLGGIEQEVLELIEEGRPGFAGGWISSAAFDRLLEEKRIAARIPQNKRREILRNLGYDWHPKLINGRVNNPIVDHGVACRPRLYVRLDSPQVGLTSGAEISRAYQEAQIVRDGLAAGAFSCG